jgi:hypothetical protein
LGRLGQIAGLLLLIGGCGLAAWGAPYYMLDWGSVLVIAGCVLASAGLICLLLGTALLRLDALRRDMALMRAVSVTEHLDAREPPPLQIGPDEREPGLDRMPAAAAAPSSGMPGLAGIAAAGVAAGGLAVAAKSILGSVVDERAEPVQTADGSMAGPDGQMAALAEGTASAENDAYQPMAEADRLGLDDLLERVSDGISRPQSEQLAHDNVPDADGDGGPSTDAALEKPAIRGDELFARIDEATRSLKDQSGWQQPAGEAETADEISDPAEKAPDSDDIFADLRADLNADMAMVPMAAPMAEDADLIEPPSLPSGDVVRAGDDGWDGDAAVTGLDHPEPADETDDEFAGEGADVPVDHGAQDAALSGLAEDADLADPETDAELAQEPDPETGPHADDPQEAPESSPVHAASPTPSDEGIVAAYTVGDSAFAMLADGRIRVTTPDEQHLFNSMDELKVFMAERRSKILPV